MRIFKIMDNKIEKILEDINKLQGYKVTYQYATAINIKDNNMNPWFEKIEEILLNVKGVIRILSPDNPPVNYDYWILPGRYKRHTKAVSYTHIRAHETRSN
ncbi:hypothetical protein E1N07_13195, partial [Staphylococcus epidermidis]